MMLFATALSQEFWLRSSLVTVYSNPFFPLLRKPRFPLFLEELRSAGDYNTQTAQYQWLKVIWKHVRLLNETRHRTRI